MEKYEAYKDSGVEWIGEIPKEWNTCRLKNLLQERKEKNLPVKTDFILSLTNREGVIPYSEKGDKGNKAKEDLTGYFLAYPGDIVLNSMNVVIGSVGLSKYFGAVSPVYYMLRPRNERDDVRFYNYLFQAPILQNELKGLGNGIMEIRMRIPMSKLNDVVLPSVDAESQKRIADYLDIKTAEIDNQISQTQKTIEFLEEYRKSVISEAVTKGLDLNAPMKDSGVEWIGKTPNAWDLIKTKYLFAIKKRIVGYEGPDVLSITQNGIKKKDTKSGEGQLAQNYSNYQWVYPGDFAMNHMDLLTGWVDCSKYEGVTSPDYRVFVPVSELVDRRFYTYLFQHCYSGKVFYGLGQGVSNLGRWRMPADEFKNFVLPVPTIVEQKEIANYLDVKTAEIDSLIEKKKQLIEKFQEYRKSLISEAVTGKFKVPGV